MFHNLTQNDLAKDFLLAALGFMPSALTQIHVALILGLCNILIVFIFRLVELSRRDRRDVEVARLRSLIAKMEAEQRAATKESR